MSAARASTAAVTLEEWGALDEDDSRELVDGALEDDEMPSFVHETIVRWLLVLLDAHFGPRGGFVAGSGVKLAVQSRRGRLADVVCYAPGRRPEPRGIVRVPPDVVVEVVSPSARDERRDRIQKPDDYAAFGVRYYWIVDPELLLTQACVAPRRAARAARCRAGFCGSRARRSRPRSARSSARACTRRPAARASG